MLSLFKLLLVRFVLARYVFGSAGALLLALPVAALLNTIGAPLLAILGAAAVPVLGVLLVVGLPIIAVLLFGGLLLGLVALVMVVGLVALKVAFFVVLPIGVLVWLARRIRRGGPGAVRVA